MSIHEHSGSDDVHVMLRRQSGTINSSFFFALKRNVSHMLRACCILRQCFELIFTGSQQIDGG
eukprot:11287751-Karenia_brevis.AAC.1